MSTRSNRIPRLRTKTGCHKCRERRKKCDEKKPTCEACERLQLTCVYGLDLPNSRITSALSLSTSSPRSQSIMLPFSPSVLKCDMDWVLTQYYSTKFIHHVTAPGADPKFTNMSFVFAATSNEQWAMHAFLACAALHASWTAMVPKENALFYNQRALRGLQRAAHTLPSAYHSDMVLAACLSLGIFEDFYTTPVSQSLVHYCAIARILEQDTADLVTFDIARFSVLRWTLLDSVLYHFSTRLIFEETIDDVCSSFPQRVITKYIHGINNERTKSMFPLVLPVLGTVPPALFLQIYHMTWLSRQRPLGAGPNHELALQCLAEINRLKNGCKTSRLGTCHFSQDSHEETNSTIGRNLYFLAAQIFAYKLESPAQVCSTSAKICGLLSKGLQLLKNYDGNACFGQFICWPLLIFGCAACPSRNSDLSQDSYSVEELLRAELRTTIQFQLLRVWQTSHSGHVKRTADTLERIWKASRGTYKGTAIAPHPAEDHDGLDALTWQNGITRFWDL